jgi:hypothetical protein
LFGRELKRELGVAPLTAREVELVFEFADEGLENLPDKKVTAKFREKLQTLGLLGRVKGDRPNVLLALKRINLAMAITQASLRELPFQERELASQLIWDRRGLMEDLFPGIQVDPLAAKRLWTKRFDDALALVATAPDGLPSQGLPIENQKIIFLLHQAGVLDRSTRRHQKVFRLNSKGEERYLRGVQEQQALEAVAPALIKLASRGSASPAVTRGRLFLAGVRVHGYTLQFIKLGRTVSINILRQQIGIEPTTPATRDLKWWKRCLDQLSELDPVLAGSFLQPEELPAHTLASLQGMDDPSFPLLKAKKRKPPVQSTAAPSPKQTPYCPPAPQTRKRTPPGPSPLLRAAQSEVGKQTKLEVKNHVKSR